MKGEAVMTREEMERIAKELNEENLRNCASIEQDFAALEKGECPNCGGHVTYTEAGLAVSWDCASCGWGLATQAMD